MTKRMTARATLAAVAAIALGPLALAGTASAQGETANATALIINGGRTVAADCPPGGGTNSPGGPFGLVTVGALTATCTDAGAQASAATVTVGTLTLGLVQSECTTGPNGTASSSVVVLNDPTGTIAPGTLVTNQVQIIVPLVGTVTLNEPINEPGFRGFNALRITAVGQTIIVAQSRCSTAAPPPAYPLQAALTAGDLGAPPISAGEGDGTPAWLFWLAGAVLVVAAGATFRPGLLGRGRTSDG